MGNCVYITRIRFTPLAVTPPGETTPHLVDIGETSYGFIISDDNESDFYDNMPLDIVSLPDIEFIRHIDCKGYGSTIDSLMSFARETGISITAERPVYSRHYDPEEIWGDE